MDVELVEDDVVDRIRSCEGTGVGGCRSRSCLGPSGLEDHDGLLHGHVLDGVDELLSVADTLEVHSDDLGVGIVGDLVEEVCLIDTCLVSECDEVGESHPVVVGPVDDGGSDRSGLGEHGDVSLSGKKVCECCVDTDPGVHDTETVGSQELDVVLLCGCDELLLELRTLGAVLFESGGEDGCVFDSGFLELGHLAGNEGRFDGDDGEVDGLTDLGDGGVCLQSLDLPSLGVDGVDGSLETSVDHVLYEHSTQLGLIVGCSDDGH